MARSCTAAIWRGGRSANGFPRFPKSRVWVGTLGRTLSPLRGYGGKSSLPWGIYGLYRGPQLGPTLRETKRNDHCDCTMFPAAQSSKPTEKPQVFERPNRWAQILTRYSRGI